MIALLRDLFLRDFWLKLFSLALAVLIWLTVSFAIRKEVSPASVLSGATGEKTFSNVPVLIMSAAADVRSFKVNPGEVTVKVRGEIKLVEQLQPKDIQALVDLTGIESARALTKRIQISTPPGITYVSVDPLEVRIIVPQKR
jgi:YbbR domain-containing protein